MARFTSRPAPANRWRALIMATVCGVTIILLGNLFARRSVHPIPSVLRQTSIEVAVPEDIKSWSAFYVTYGPLPCPAYYRTLMAVAAQDESVPFPKDGKVNLYFDESSPGQDKEVSERGRANVVSLLKAVALPDCGGNL
jgi:hypothetical protein